MKILCAIIFIIIIIIVVGYRFFVSADTSISASLDRQRGCHCLCLWRFSFNGWEWNGMETTCIIKIYNRNDKKKATPASQPNNENNIQPLKVEHHHHRTLMSGRGG